MRDPATADEQGHTPARRAYLEHWRSVDEIHLGGGQLVERDVEAAVRSALGEHGAPPTTVHAARRPRELALVGAARTLPPDDGDHLVLDGGHTTLKRGIATVRDGRLAEVRVLPSFRLADAPLDELFTTALSERPADVVVASVAAYVADGRPADGASVYDALDFDAVEAATGADLRLVHDGTAAWRGTGATGVSAVIVLGTWLGVGLGPHRTPLLPLGSLPSGQPPRWLTRG